MQTKLSAFAARISEAGWLAALIIVPILFNVYTERVFEEDKIPLMRSIALLMLVAFIVWAVEQGREALAANDGRPWWKIPLVVPALVLAAAYLLATVFSIVPRISFWGAYIRRQGTYTWLSYTIIFFSILFLTRDRKQVTRIITLILLTSVPASLYAFLQNRGLDPMPWGGDVTRRVSSTAGNPIFIAAYLIMVIPFTLMRVIEHFKQLLRTSDEEEDESEAPNYLASSLLAGAYLFLLIIQIITIVYSQSRGPLLGLLVGMTFFTILASRYVNRWLPLAFTGLAVAGIVFLVVLNLPNTPLEPLKEVQYVGRLGSVFQLNSGNGKVRALIWEGALDLLEADPLRDLVGYGPEAMYVAYNQHYPPELAQVEKRNASPDRSHNETLDSLVMTGVLGFLAQTFFFLSIFYYIFKWLGLIKSDSQRYLFIGLIIFMGSGGAILPYLVEGQFRLSGAGFPAGIALGVIAYLLGYVLTHLNEESEQHPHGLLLITLLSAIMGHYIEAHFGIAIGVTRLYFWIYAALAVVVGLPLLRGEPEKSAILSDKPSTNPRRQRRQKRNQARKRNTSVLSGTLISLSLMMGLLLMIMTFNFYTPTIDLTVKGGAMIWLFLGTWLFGALVVVAEAAFEQDETGDWLPRLGVYAAISLATWFFFMLIYTTSIQTPQISGQITIDQLKGLGGRLANAITILYVFVFMMIGLTAAMLQREAPPSRTTWRSPALMVPVYGVLLIAIVPIMVTTNLNVSRADVYNKQGSGYERNRQWDAAIIFYDTALELQPTEDRYFLNMGRAYMEKARQAGDDPAQRTQFMNQAREVLQRAQRTNPLNTDHTRNLASLHRVWATMEPERREALLEEADGYYAQAVELSPNNAAIWNDWAALYAERGQLERAYDILDHSLQIDDKWINTYLLQANIATQSGDYEIALAAYEKGIELSPKNKDALSGKAFVLARMDRTEEAIIANEALREIAPTDYNTHKNLAILYQQSTQIEKAREVAQIAVTLTSDPQEKAAMEAFIQQLTP